MPDFDILVVGEANPDLILAGHDLQVRFGQHETLVETMDLAIGSSSVIFACGAARLGLKVAMVGIVGRDLFGEFMLRSMKARGVDVSHLVADPNSRTGLSIILNRKSDRAILTFPGAISALKARQVKNRLLEKARHLHVGSYFLQTALQPGLPDLFRRARKRGLTVSLDTNWDPEARWSGVLECLPLTDVFLPNENEAKILTGKSSPEEALAILAEIVPAVAIKLGAKGAIAQQGREFANAPALPVEVVDTIGAGDSFDAGFLYGYLGDWPLLRSLQLATACGSLSTRGPGGTAAQPDLDGAMQYLS